MAVQRVTTEHVHLGNPTVLPGVCRRVHLGKVESPSSATSGLPLLTFSWRRTLPARCQHFVEHC
jgi:hypothetical protein